MTRSSTAHYWIYIQEVSNIREGTWLYQFPSDFPCAVCLPVIVFFYTLICYGRTQVISAITAQIKWDSMDQEKGWVICAWSWQRFPALSSFKTMNLQLFSFKISPHPWKLLCVVSDRKEASSLYSDHTYFYLQNRWISFLHILPNIHNFSNGVSAILCLHWMEIIFPGIH